MFGLALRRRTLELREEWNAPAVPSGWTTTDTGGKLVVSGGALGISGRAAPGWDDPRLTYTRRSWLPKAGLTYECEMTFTDFGTNGCQFGFAAATPVAEAMRPSFQVYASGVLRVIQAQAPIARQATPVTLSTGVDYRFKLVLLDPTEGVLWLYSADRGATWLPVFKDSQWPTATDRLYVGLDNYDAQASQSYVRVYRGQKPRPSLADDFAARTSPGQADSAQPWLGLSGQPLPVIAGDLRIPAGSTQIWIITPTGHGDGIYAADLNFGVTGGSTKQSLWAFRWRDVANYMRITINRVGQSLAIARIANGVAANVVSASAMGWADNTTYRFAVVCSGPVIVVYQDGVEKLRVTESFGRYFGLSSFNLSDNQATPDIRLDNLRCWGFPARAAYADSFDRPDSDVSLGTADSGQAYTPQTSGGGETPVWGIESGAAKLVAGTGSDKTARVSLARGSYLAWGRLRTITTGSGITGFLLRWLDDNNWLAMRLAFTVPNSVAIFRDLAGVRTNVTSSSAVGTLVQDTDYLVVVLVTGNTFEVWFNGARVISVSDVNFPTSPAGGAYDSSSVPRIAALRCVPLGTALVHDTYTRVDSTTTPGTTELPGTPWTVFQGTLGVISNRAYSVSDANGDGMSVPIFADNYALQATISGTLNSATVYRSPTLLLNRNADGSLLRCRLLAGAIQLVSRTAGGVDTVLGTAATATSNGVDYDLRAEVRGKQVTLVKDGVSLATVLLSDADAAAYLPTGLKQVGLWLGKAGAPATAARFDNFLAVEVA